MKRTYTVNPSSPFILYFKNVEDYGTFINEYSSAEGFSFIKGEKGYKLFTSAHSFNAYRFVDKKEYGEPAIGIGISSCEPIHQKITLNIALKALRVRGLDSYHACYKGLSRSPIYSNGAPRFFEYVDSFFDCMETETDEEVENDAYIDFLDTYEAIVEREEEFSLLSPFTAEYTDIEPVQQNDRDGVVYKFKTAKRSCNPKNKAMVKVISDDGSARYNASVTGHDSTGVFLRFSKNSSFSYTQSSACGKIEENVNVEFPLKKKALGALRSNSCINKRFLDVIVGKKLLPLKAEKKYSPYDKDGNLKARVNASQIEAISKALNTKDFLLVQGPPGTGKTTIITEMVKSFVEDGLKVLICSKNNLPVDNVIEKCKDLYHDDDKTRKMLCLRLGQEENVLQSVKSQLSRPLAVTIENDVKERSETARNERLSHEDAVIETCANAKKATAPIGDLIFFFANQNAFFTKAEKRFKKSVSGIIFSILLGSRRTKKTKKSLEDAVKLSLEATAMLTELFKYESYTATPGYVNATNLKVSAFFDALTVLNGELKSAPKRYKWTLGNLYDSAIASSSGAEAKKTNFIKEISDTVFAYKGNAAAGIFSETYAPDEVYSDPTAYTKFFSALAERQRKAEATKARFKNILDEWHGELMEDQQVIEEPLVQCVKIIGATCIGVNTTPAFSSAEYDVAIVDEAGQITSYDLLVPLVKAKKIILIGDHIQLPPSGNNDFCDYVEENSLLDFEDRKAVTSISELRETYSVSLFEKLFLDPAFDKNKVMLDTQFRMNPVIAEFISESFYDGKYKSGVTEDERTLNIGGFTRPMYFIDTAGSPRRFEDVMKSCEDHANSFEAEILAENIARVIADIENGTFTGSTDSLKNEDGDYDIGIITAYKPQIDLVSEKLYQKLRSYYNEIQTDEILSHLSVNTLDSFQGRDNQIIFYSFVRSNPHHSIGFLNDIRRINVMMTRAKSLLVMVGDSETLTKAGKRTVHSGEKTDDFYKKLIGYCKKAGGYVRAEL